MEFYAREKGWAYPPLPPFILRQRLVEDKQSFLVLIFNQPLQVWGQWESPTVMLPPPLSRSPPLLIAYHSHSGEEVGQRSGANC